MLNHLSVPVPDQAEIDEERDKADNGKGPLSLVEQREQSGLIHAALLALPPRYRVVIELRHFQELSYDEIALTLDRPMSDIKSDLFRARKMLTEKLKDDASL